MKEKEEDIKDTLRDSTFQKYCLVVNHWLVNGFNGTLAYLKVYPDAQSDTAASEFHRIIRIPKVQAYKEDKLNSIAESNQISLSKQLLRLDYIINEAEDSNSKISAIKEQNKLLALYEEHNSQKTKGSVNVSIDKWIQDNDA